MKRAKVIVGMSGGVDSSVAAALLVKQGFEVHGVFMKNWASDDPRFQGVCPWEQDLRDAKTVAARLGIPLTVWNFEKEYHRQVVKYFFDEYRRGRTPNPDVMCNKEIKFGAFLKRALKSKVDYIATGHYARITSKFKSQNSNLKIFQLLKGADDNKDQSYFLWAIDRKVLPKILFPVGEHTKSEVRQLARRLKLPVANKKDSQGICFIGPIDVREYLKTELPVKPGRTIDTKGKVVGQHEGIWFYTEGQRTGIGTSGAVLPYYVVRKNRQKNELVVAHRADRALYSSNLTAQKINWLLPTPLLQKMKNNLGARIRYRHPIVPVSVTLINNRKIKATFPSPVRAVTPGQSVVFYSGDLVVGGGIIN